MREIMSPSGAQWEIASGDQRAVIVEVGGGLRSYTIGGAPIIDGFGEDEVCPGAAGDVLLPWPNRIRDGQYTFGGHTNQLALSEPPTGTAIHGLSRWLTWTPADRAADRITVECTVAAQSGYPWTLRARTTWALDEGGLSATHEVTNLAADAAPFGLGIHPYLRIDGVAVDDLWLSLPAHSRLLSDGRLLPIGAAKVAGGPYDFTEGRRIGDAVIDCAFGDVQHDADGITTARLATADGSRVREIWADGGFRWWQAFTGDTLHGDRRRRSVAVEPMTCPPDAFRSGRNVITVESGETWRGRWGIRAIGV